MTGSVHTHRSSQEHPSRSQPDTLRWSFLLLLADVFAWVDAWLLWREGLSVLAAIVAYAALSLAAVTGLYLYASRGNNPGPYLKGERALWLQPLFAPFRLVAYGVCVAARLVRRSPAWSEVAPGVFVGVRLWPFEASKLHALNVHAVVDLCAELPTNTVMDQAPFVRLQLPVLDRCPPTHEELTHAAEWIASQREQGRSVYVHCAFGRGRSAMVAGAALVRLGHARDANEAVAQLTKARPVVHVRGAQFAALDRYASSRRQASARS